MGQSTYKFDFRLRVDSSTLVGPHYFGLAPGPYDRTTYEGKHRRPGSRFIDEFTFCLFEGIFERYVPAYDHFACVEVTRSQWKLILRDLVTLRTVLSQIRVPATVALPYGTTLRPYLQEFEQNWAANQRELASLLFNLEQWLNETLTLHEVVSVLGL